MGYDLIWQPYKSGWAVWSTVVDAFVCEGIQTPEGVADFIIGNKEFYYLDRWEKNIRTGVEEQVIATCQYLSRMDIVNYYTRFLDDVHELRVKTLTEHGWEEQVTPAEQVRENLERSYAHAIQQWEAGKIYPDPKAKEEIRKYWIDEAERVKREGVLTISGMQFEISESGLEYKGEVTKGPEIW